MSDASLVLRPGRRQHVVLTHNGCVAEADVESSLYMDPNAPTVRIEVTDVRFTLRAAVEVKA